MEVQKVQAILSLIIVLAFAIVTTIIALAPVIGGYPPEGYTEHFKSFTSVYAGGIGVILGFYFGKAIQKQ